MLNGHDRQDCPRINGNRSCGAAVMTIRIAATQTTSTGIAMTGQATPTFARRGGPAGPLRSGRRSQDIAGNASFSQKIAVLTITPRSGRMPNTATVNAVAPIAATGSETLNRRAAVPLLRALCRSRATRQDHLFSCNSPDVRGQSLESPVDTDLDS